MFNTFRELHDEAAMADEMTKYASNLTDEYGWTDLDWFRYLKDEKANEQNPPKLLEEFASGGVVFLPVKAGTQQRYVDEEGARHHAYERLAGAEEIPTKR